MMMMNITQCVGDFGIIHLFICLLNYRLASLLDYRVDFELVVLLEANGVFIQAPEDKNLRLTDGLYFVCFIHEIPV